MNFENNIEDEVKYLDKKYGTFFSIYGFEKKEYNAGIIRYANTCMIMEFTYETRYITSFSELFIIEIATQYRYQFRDLLEYFEKNIKYQDLIEMYTGKSGSRKMSVEEAYLTLIEKHLTSTFKNCDFSWSAEFIRWKTERDKNCSWNK